MGEVRRTGGSTGFGSTSIGSRAHGRRRGRPVALALVLGLLLTGLVGCGGGQSDQQAYCDAGAALRTSMTALADVNVVSEGTNGVKDAVAKVKDDFDALRAAATDATKDQVDALSQALDELNAALSSLSGEISSDNATAVKTAIQNVATAAQGVYDTLTDC